MTGLPITGMLDGKVAVITGAGSGMAKASVTRVRARGRQGRRRRHQRRGEGRRGRGRRGRDARALRRHQGGRRRSRRCAPRSTSSVGSTRCATSPASATPRWSADVTMEHYDRVMDIDLRGVVLGTKHAIRTMLECGNGGSIVNWSSIGGLNASPATGMYSAAKAGVISITKSAAIEYAPQEHPRQLRVPRLHQDRGHGRGSRQLSRRGREHPDAAARAARRGRRGRRRSCARTAHRSSPARSSRSTAAALS